MINRIFTIYDPSSKIFSTTTVYLIICIYLTWISSKTPKFNQKLISIQNFITNQTKQRIENKKILQIENLNSKIFTIILIINISALTPYSWCSTGQLSFNISIIIRIFSCIIVITIIKIENFLIHLTPPNSPNLIAPFITIVELVRWIIRPLTLVLRLTANLVSGHILLHLIRSISIKTNLISASILITISSPIIILETAVAVIQAYIIITLSSLYKKDT